MWGYHIWIKGCISKTLDNIKHAEFQTIWKVMGPFYHPWGCPPPRSNTNTLYSSVGSPALTLVNPNLFLRKVIVLLFHIKWDVIHILCCVLSILHSLKSHKIYPHFKLLDYLTIGILIHRCYGRKLDWFSLENTLCMFPKLYELAKFSEYTYHDQE